MVIFDVGLGFGIGCVFKRYARKDVRGLVTLACALGVAPAAMAFLSLYPDWDLQYLVPKESVPPWFPGVFCFGSLRFVGSRTSRTLVKDDSHLHGGVWRVLPLEFDTHHNRHFVQHFMPATLLTCLSFSSTGFGVPAQQSFCSLRGASRSSVIEHSPDGLLFFTPRSTLAQVADALLDILYSMKNSFLRPLIKRNSRST